MLFYYFTRFQDHEDMLEDSLNVEYPRRPDGGDLYPGFNVGLPMWESYPVLTKKFKKEENLGLAEAITKSILSTGNVKLTIFYIFHTTHAYLKLIYHMRF